MHDKHRVVEIAVCTSIGEEESNFALCGEARDMLTKEPIIALTPVWIVGELVFLGPDGRCVVTTRKPKKWSAKFKYFKLEQLDDALALSETLVNK